jgi:hypothetical protein
MSGPSCTKCFNPLDHYGNVWVCTLCVTEEDMKDMRRQIAKIEALHRRQIERGMGPGLKCRDCSDLIEWDEGTMAPPDYCEVCFKLRRLVILEGRIDRALELMSHWKHRPKSNLVYLEYETMLAIRSALTGEGE